MGTNSGVRVTGADLSRNLTIYAEAIPYAMEDAVEMAADAAAVAMAHRIKTAPNTKKGPGRVDTGTLLESIEDTAGGIGSSNAYRIRYNRGGNLSVDIGFLDGPDYTIFQEQGTSRGIIPMLAVQEGFNAFASHIYEDIADRLSEAGRDAQAGRMYRRARRAR